MNPYCPGCGQRIELHQDIGVDRENRCWWHNTCWCEWWQRWPDG
jgi:hypothetical protein